MLRHWHILDNNFRRLQFGELAWLITKIKRAFNSTTCNHLQNMKHSICSTCDNKASYCEQFDAMYCSSCNTWLEKNCTDPGCNYCSGRPETPTRWFNGKPKTFSDIIGPAISLDHFLSLVASGRIATDDGNVGAIFIDGIGNPDIWISPNWSFAPNDFRMCKAISLDELAKKFPGKTIQLEWLTK